MDLRLQFIPTWRKGCLSIYGTLDSMLEIEG
jgi:hypothetical protein